MRQIRPADLFMVENRYPEQHQIFLIKAKQDLSLVREVLHSDAVAPEILLFHLQQAVEKLIKGLLTFHGIQFPQTHDLEDLIELAEDNRVELPPLMEDLSELTPYAVEARYAILHDDLHDISELLNKVEQFRDFAEKEMLVSHGVRKERP